MLRSTLLAPIAFWLALPALAGSTLDVPGSYPTIADALLAAASGDTILVQPGVYAEHDLNPAGKDLDLISVGGAAVTTIDAGGLGRVLYLDTLTTMTVNVEGFTLRGGRAPAGIDATGYQSGGPGEHGGAVYSLYASATFRGCVFVDNEAGTGGVGGDGIDGTSQSFGGTDGGDGYWGGIGGYGGAIYVGGGSLTLEACRFEQNRGGIGGLGGEGGRGGSGSGGPFGGTPGGDGGDGGNGGRGGSGGAVHVAWGDLFVRGCVFYANAGGDGGPGGPGGQGGYGDPYGSYGSVGDDGRSGDGSAIYQNAVTCEVTSCTFAANTSVDPYNGGVVYGAGAVLRNTLVWGNDLPSLYGLQTVDYCDIEGGAVGASNLDVDPLYADLAGGDLHLTTGSLCLHAGDSAAPGMLATDLDGDPRIVGAAVDIGEDEAWWPLMGTGEDLLLETLVNGAGDVYADGKPALAGDLVSVRFHSPGGTFVGSIPWLLAQGYNTGSILSPDPFNLGLVVNTTMPNFALVTFGGGPLGPWLLPTGGMTALYQVGPGLVGISVRFQALVLSPLARNGIYATSDGLDLVLQ